MYSLLKLSAGILLCLPLTGCVGPGYYDPSTGMVCGGQFYGPTNFVDDIKCSLSEHRAHRMRKRCCNPCGSCCTGGCRSSVPGMLASGTFNIQGPVDSYAPQTYAPESYAPQTYAPESSCPHCGPQGAHGSNFSPGEVIGSPTTVVPQKITPAPENGHNSILNKPAPAPAAEDPMPKSSSVPPAMLHAPTVIPDSAIHQQGTRRVQWVPAQVH